MVEATLTIAPLLRAHMWRAAARAHRNTPVMLTATTFSQSASGWSSAGWRSPMPAPLTRTSMPPWRLATAAIAASTDASSPTSTACAEAALPSARAAGSAASPSRSRSATAAHAATKVAAVARPIPRAPPVTTATFPSRRNRVSGSSGIATLPRRPLGLLSYYSRIVPGSEKFADLVQGAIRSPRPGYLLVTLPNIWGHQCLRRGAPRFCRWAYHLLPTLPAGLTGEAVSRENPQAESNGHPPEIRQQLTRAMRHFWMGCRGWVGRRGRRG